MSLDLLEHDSHLAREFELLEEALMAPRFSEKNYENGFISYWIRVQYDVLVERMQWTLDQVREQEDRQEIFVEREEGNLWHKHLRHCFSLCRSTKAKRAVWAGIASSQVSQLNGSILKQSALFLKDNVQWAPKNVHLYWTNVFAGIFSSGFYTPQSLVAAAHWMQQGSEQGATYIRDWLGSIGLAPGVLPVQHYLSSAKAANGASPDAGRASLNTMLWTQVVVPYCQMHPQDNFLAEKTFFHLPMLQTPETLNTTKAILQALPCEYQKQWLYANTLEGLKTKNTFETFWKHALLADVSPQDRALRLYLATSFLSESDATRFSREVDPNTIAVLEGLGTNNRDTLRQFLYSRWMEKSTEPIALPQNWYDENTALGL